jgi:hypothetical protein
MHRAPRNTTSIKGGVGCATKSIRATASFHGRVENRGLSLRDDSPTTLARIFHELLSRDHEDGRATWQPQGVGSEAYLNGTSQGPTPEDARKDGHIRGRSK